MSEQKAYRIIFTQQNEVYEVYVRHMYQSNIFGFIEVEEFVFGCRSQVVVDPSEDKLKTEFDGVKRSFIPMTSIVRIDEVKKEGQAKISPLNGSKVARLPHSTER